MASPTVASRIDRIIKQRRVLDKAKQNNDDARKRINALDEKLQEPENLNQVGLVAFEGAREGYGDIVDIKAKIGKYLEDIRTSLEGKLTPAENCIVHGFLLKGEQFNKENIDEWQGQYGCGDIELPEGFSGTA